MADKSVSELIAAQSVTPTDLFVLEQNGTAKKLTGQILENWLVSFADGHGGIQSIEKVSTSVLVDTYRITLADTTTFDFVVTNGRSVNSITKTSTNGLVDTYTIQFNDNTRSTFTVTNGEKGDKGDNQYIWIKYASQKPTASSHSFGDVADNWIGVYSGESATAPTDWTQYEWFQIKGEKGDTGDPAKLTSSTVEYQVSDSGTIIPSGAWSASVPVVAQGKYMWTRTTQTFNTGSPVVAYSVSRMGIDGSGSVSSVAGVSPNADGNITLKAEDVGALPSTGGDLTGELKMNGQPISGLNVPTANDHAANMGFVNQQVRKASPRNLLDNSDFRNPVNQRGKTSYTESGYTIDRWKSFVQQPVNIGSDGITLDGTNGEIVLRQQLESLKDGTYTLAAKVGEYILVRQYKKEGVTYTRVYANADYQGGYVQLVSNSGVPAFQFRVFPGISVTFEWAALYEGEYTEETLPEYQPKGYAVELAECQRYYYEIDKMVLFGYITTNATQFYSGTLPEITRMRTTPTLTMSGNLVCRSVTGYATAEGFTDGNGGSVSLVTTPYITALDGISFKFATTAASVNNSPFVVSCDKLTLSADL